MHSKGISQSRENIISVSKLISYEMETFTKIKPVEFLENQFAKASGSGNSAAGEEGFVCEEYTPFKAVFKEKLERD